MSRLSRHKNNLYQAFFSKKYRQGNAAHETGKKRQASDCLKSIILQTHRIRESGFWGLRKQALNHNVSKFAVPIYNKSTFADREKSHVRSRNPYREKILNPATPATINSRQTRRSVSRGSSKSTIPAKATPAAPIPVQTA